MPHNKDLHLARRLMSAIGSESMEDVLAAALTVSTQSVCRAFGVSPVRHTTSVNMFRETMVEAVAYLLRDLAEDLEAAEKSN